MRSGVSPYADCGEIAGPLLDASGETVVFRRVVVGSARRVLWGLVLASAVAEIAFLAWLLAPGRWSGVLAVGGIRGALGLAAFAAIAVVEVARLLQALPLWVSSLAARDPVPMRPPAELRIAVLTTIVPSCEPLALVAETLAAMRSIDYEHGVVDVWILDEEDDPAVRQVAERLGVKHFSRHSIAAFNTASGPFRARTKAGNHNAWLAVHGDEYDVVAQLDPDHVPERSFLTRTLGYFRDPDVAFVVAPQVYGSPEGLIEHGAAAQAYVFHGVVQRGGNGLGAPLLIGTNHVYRAAAWRQIGGYQDSLIEDHLTSMTVHGTVNPLSGRRWKGVYTPDVLAVGHGPATWSDFFAQQRRWSYGVTEIVLRHAWQLHGRLAGRQRLAYVMLQAFYPCVAVSWLAGTFCTLVYLLGAAEAPRLGAWWPILWAISWVTTLALFMWLRRFNIAPHERKELGTRGAMATLCAGPVYVSAFVSAVLGRPLAYHVTPKGNASRPDCPATFRLHLAWVGVLATALAASVPVGGALVPRCWALLTLGAAALPSALHVLFELRAQSPALATSKPSTVRSP
jgi:glycosyl transferase family 2